MVLELHVWGPAFGLPSIDPQCLATIAYFSLVLPKDAWVLIASSDPSVSPTNELPALKNGKAWVSRFRNIVDYLRQYSNGEWDLDEVLSGTDRADNIAFSSFIESRGQPLIDLSLYITSQNYYDKTSPAYGAILQWPNQWIIPPRLHSAAKKRTEPLGLSSLDLQAMEDQRKREHSAAVAAGQIPENLIQRPRDTVSGLLGKTAQQNRFKLEALTAELFDPLEEMLGQKSYFFPGDKPATADCLALGYLSLALVPDLPYPWLRDAMKIKAPNLSRYTERLRQHCYGAVAVDVSHAFDGPSRPATDAASPLPWLAPARATAVTVGSTLLNTLADATPILKNIRAHERLRQAAQSPDSGLSRVESHALSAYATGQKKDVLVSVAAVVGGVAALLGYMAHVGLLQISYGSDEEEWEEEEEEEEEEQQEGGIAGIPESLSATEFLNF
ncbi:putative mitochondrial import receptor subunit (Tom37) [Aspergillus clavatus NRRL 1]|uniref:Mitochondrial import receptor subunit (Tom37), putative n=1 Tax=Aspergillus clavatus (strain ATCC 1007 / CBS 513.65 / DSM 816 / NCTC 3887 / NRRL 1 / QM 1276 / 107) TaxID=344612 RepID=A1CES6_ASPCL|nr:mitochondrial import receptor subunit (Tom37), putative [Aspergillus clavatus NRRL 1]EAW11375.1 mitochondrial import receptor subunit (Tom37), putative [Aspergillus clavatus NRRL 1]